LILVVGGAGYIGSHMCLQLHEAGEPFLAFDNFSSGHEAALQGAAFIRGDLRSRSDLDAIFQSHEIELVMHFAAHISVGESVREPSKYYDNNLAGVLILLEAMRAHDVKRFVFSSTAAIFGEPRYVPIDEDHPKAPTSPYGQSKLMVESVLADYDRAYGIKSVCLRYFNAAGADPSGRIGEDHSPEEHLIPVAIQAALGLRPPLKIFGTDYETPDGTCVRDYVHVLDLAEAHQLAVLHLRSGRESRAFNLGNGQGFSVRQVIEMVEQVSGRTVPREEAPRRPGDPAQLVASSERIRKELGWQPQFPRLQQIVETAWNWHHDHPRGYAS
jgi:UDP-glucose 4-epimerase